VTNLAELRPEELDAIDDEALRNAAAEYLSLVEEDRKANQILFYQPASPRAQLVHDSKAKVLGIGGGNGSSKTETMLVEIIMCATGIFPESQRHLIEQKFKGPIKCRLTVESLTTTLEPIILPKLMWWKWTGVDRPGGERGHYGWIPKSCLKDGEWDKSYSHKLRMLTLICRNPYNTEEVLGESTIQFMSVDMDPSDFASGDMDICAHDEPPTLAIWRENEARTMRTGGRMMLAMTWPDDPSINVDWLYDEVYEPGRTGNDPTIMWLELWTTENRNLKQESVAEQLAKWSPEMAAVRGFGRPIRFSNRIHPEFTDNTKTWCFRCDKSTIPVPIVNTERSACGQCGSEEIVDYNHVQEFGASGTWPTVFLIDPHPRRAHMYLWVMIDPSDDWWVIADGKCEGDCVDTRKEANRVEQEMGLFVAQRLTDPNMALSPASSKRGITWQDEFATAGLVLDLADDAEVGRGRVNVMFKPDAQTLRPRIHIHPRCRDTSYQLQRFSWDDYSKRVDRDQKQVPKDKHSDYPTLLKYLANSEPNFRFLRDGGRVMARPGRRRGSY
jgi:hypothetical protein